MKLLLLILAIIVIVLLLLLCLVDPKFVTVLHTTEFLAGALALFFASFLPIP